MSFCCHFSVDLLHSLYPELLKRMDDSSDEIRVFVTTTLLAFFRYDTFKRTVHICRCTFVNNKKLFCMFIELSRQIMIKIYINFTLKRCLKDCWYIWMTLHLISRYLKQRAILFCLHLVPLRPASRYISVFVGGVQMSCGLLRTR